MVESSGSLLLSPAHAPTVVYIAGSGRSGSTLLERILGSIPGFVNVGELIDLFRRVAPDDERCGCGVRFSTCPFWVGVGERAFGGWTKEILTEFNDLQAKNARQRHIPGLLIRRARRDGSTSRYHRLYATLYRAILDETGAQYVVDASKWPAQALALRTTEIDMRVLHLVRDVCGVAHSMQKLDMARPHATASRQLMVHSGPVRTAARWTITQAEVDLLRLKGMPLTRVRYEDLVSDPVSTIQTSLADIGLGAERTSLSHVGAKDVHLGPSHGLAGNPSRFREGAISLRLDDEWRSQMSRRQRAALATITLPGKVLQNISSSPSNAADDDSAEPETTTSATPRDDGIRWPLVSVVLPTRGRPELVRQSISTVINQTYPGEIECLVVHDQETPDYELATLGTARRTVTTLANVHTPGLTGARNTGLDHAKGQFIASCDDDDLWHPEKLTKQIRLLDAEPDLLVVGAGIRLLLPENRIVEWPGRADRIEQATLLRNRVKELHSSTLVMRRDAFAKAGRYNERLPHAYAEDYDWVLRAARVGKIGVCTEPLADIRKDVQSWFRERAQNTAEALTYLMEIHPELRSSRRGHARILGQIAFAQASLDRRHDSLHTLGRSLRRYPLSPHAYLALFQVVTGSEPQLLLKTARIFRRGLS